MLLHLFIGLLLTRLMNMLQARLKREQEEKEQKKKEKAEAHLYTIIKVFSLNIPPFSVITGTNEWCLS